jgi:hypothetical protein
MRASERHGFAPEDASRMSMAFGAEILFAPEVVARAKAALALT